MHAFRLWDREVTVQFMKNKGIRIYFSFKLLPPAGRQRVVQLCNVISIFIRLQVFQQIATACLGVTIPIVYTVHIWR